MRLLEWDTKVIGWQVQRIGAEHPDGWVSEESDVLANTPAWYMALLTVE